ncbi:MAG: prolyl oligopeptidase family serine peptidase, partial [Pseudomonadota bacterium]
ETLIDLDALAKVEDEDWIYGGSDPCPQAPDRVLIWLSRGGSDAKVLREFDLTTMSFVADGFHLPEAKSSALWLDADTLMICSAYGGDEHATTSGYARTARLLRRGQSIDDAPVVGQTRADAMAMAVAPVTRDPVGDRLWFVTIENFFSNTTMIGTREGPSQALDIPDDTRWSQRGDWIVLARRSAWEIDNVTHPPDTVLATPLSALLEGAPRYTALFTSSERYAYENHWWNDEALIVYAHENLEPRHMRFTPQADGTWARTMVEGLPDVGIVHMRPLDDIEREQTGDLIANTQDPITPPRLSLIERGRAPAVMKSMPPAFDAKGLRVERLEATSHDGTRVPYVQVGPADAGKNKGQAPVYMYGYGGFGLTMEASYRVGLGKLWLERGGTFISANLRGGGEFGTPWHDAGRREGKARSHDDFAAIAQDLVARGVTQPKRIAAEGGSNGGLLIANMLTRYPERFGALFCTIPLIDMRRYTKLLAGASWIAEYGDPDIAEDWAFLQHISAYHTAVPGQAYPPILIATTRKDDRVHPGHARKMAAKLQAMGYEADFYEIAEGGHGYGKDNAQRATFTTLGLAFLREKIGWTDET